MYFKQVIFNNYNQIPNKIYEFLYNFYESHNNVKLKLFLPFFLWDFYSLGHY